MKETVIKQKNSDSAIPPSIGSIVEGKVVARDRSSLFIDLGNQGTGIIYGREFYEVKEAIKSLNIGDTVFAAAASPFSPIASGKASIGMITG